MNSMLRALFIFITGFAFATLSNADNGISHSSKINGVNFFWTFLTADSPPSDLFEEGNGGKGIIEHCNGKNLLYIHELASKSFICKSIKSHQDYYSISLVGVNQADVVKAPHILLSNHQGILTVSKTPLPQLRWKIEPLSDEEIVRLQSLAKNNFECPTDHPCKRLSGKEFDPSLQLYEGQIRSAEIDNLAIAIKGGINDLYVVPIAVELVGDVDGGTAVFNSAVFSKTENADKFVGILSGSLIRVGADIDQDGMPEIIVDNSIETTQTINYTKIHPVIDSLVTYTHW